MVEFLRSFSLSVFVLSYVLSESLSSIIGMDPSTQKMICLIPFACFTFLSKCAVNEINFILKIFLSISVLLLLQFFMCAPFEFSTRLFINLLFLFIVSYKEIPLKSLIRIFCFVKISALLVAISVFQLYLIYGGYAREEALIDKSLASGILALSFMACWIDIILNRNRIINAIIITFLLYVDVFIIVSKTSVFAFFIFIIITFFCMSKEDRRMYLKLSKYVLIIICVLALIFPNVALPNDLKETINTIAGYEVYELSRVRIDNTFSIRHYLMEYCINELFLNHPFIGIGIGNFAYYNHSFYSNLEETESSALSIITEGGIYYAITIGIFYFFLIKRGIKRIRENLGYKECIGIGIPVIYFILCIGNDFMDALFWMMMGIVYSILFPKNKYINHQCQ